MSPSKGGWTGIDSFNKDSSSWTSFSNVFGATYSHLLQLAPSKPIMIAEIGSKESGGSKASWITDALSTQLPKYFPQVKALVWFNWRIYQNSSWWPFEIEAIVQTEFVGFKRRPFGGVHDRPRRFTQRVSDFAVVICTYAPERWSRLRDAVRSVQQQTLAPREVIVVVDHNDSLLARARRELDDIVVIANSEARGLRGARNSGVNAATASCVAFLDDDAQATEQWLELLAGPYEDPEVAGVGGLTLPVWDGGRPGWFPHEFEWVVGGAYRGMPLARQDVRNLWGGNMSFRRDLVTEIGGFRIGYSCDDTELCIRLRQRWPSKRFIFLPEAKVLHHVERARMTMPRFLSRCYFEGGSKAVLTRLTGAHDGLASERRYTREVLPNGLKHGVVDFAWRLDPAGIARMTMIIGGFASALTGYLVGHATPTRTARKRGWDGEPLGRIGRPSPAATDGTLSSGEHVLERHD